MPPAADLLVRLLDLLQQEEQLLQAGAAEDLPPLTDRKRQLLAELAGLQQPDWQPPAVDVLIRKIRALNASNGALVAARINMTGRLLDALLGRNQTGAYGTFESSPVTATRVDRKA